MDSPNHTAHKDDADRRPSYRTLSDRASAASSLRAMFSGASTPSGVKTPRTPGLHEGEEARLLVGGRDVEAGPAEYGSRALGEFVALDGLFRRFEALGCLCVTAAAGIAVECCPLGTLKSCR